jgi:WD40 repeat protein
MSTNNRLIQLLILTSFCVTLSGCGYFEARRQAERALLQARAAAEAEAQARLQAEEALAKAEALRATVERGGVAPPESELEALADEAKRNAAAQQDDLKKKADELKKAAGDELQKKADEVKDAVKKVLGGADKPAEPKPVEKEKPNPNLLHLLEGHTGPVLGVAYSPDGKRIASASADKSVRVWNAKTGEAMATLAGHKDDVTCVAFTADGKRVVSGSADKTIRIWDLSLGLGDKKEAKVLEGHEDGVTCLAIFADGKRLITGGMDKTLRLWDLETGLPTAICKGHTLGVLCVAVTDDGKHALSGGQDRTVRLWNLADKPVEQGRVEPHKGWVKGVAIADDNQQAISVGLDGQCAVLAISFGALNLSHKKDSKAGAIHCAVLRNGDLALIGLEDKSVRRLHWLSYTNWDFASSHTVLSAADHKGPVLAVAMSPDALIAVTGSEDKTVRVWKQAAGK